MREIVHLQAGQCGNQIGAKVFHQNIPLLPSRRIASSNVNTIRVSKCCFIEREIEKSLSEGKRSTGPSRGISRRVRISRLVARHEMIELLRLVSANRDAENQSEIEKEMIKRKTNKQIL